ncbi:MAG: hypothetical protein V1836_00650 [Candidatus Aenigmatarchaeota archaeon]
MKAITPVISLIMMMLITVGLTGAAYAWFNSMASSQTSQAFKIIGANYGEILVNNIGTDVISSLTAFVDGQQVNANLPSPIAPGTAGKVFLENLPATSGDHTIRLLSSSIGVETKTKYNLIKVLSIYRCECFIDDMAANFANKNGYPPMIVDCIHESSFTDSYDLSLYNVVAFDGVDAGPSDMSTNKQQKLENFVASGKSIVFTHDSFYQDKNQILQTVAGVDVLESCCPGIATNKLITDKITEKPYALPSILSVQSTHSSGEHKTTATEIFGGAGVTDHYLLTNNYGNGESAFIQWGHSARGGGCEVKLGLPGADEQKSIINSIYWVAGV